MLSNGIQTLVINVTKSTRNSNTLGTAHRDLSLQAATDISRELRTPPKAIAPNVDAPRIPAATNPKPIAAVLKSGAAEGRVKGEGTGIGDRGERAPADDSVTEDETEDENTVMAVEGNVLRLNISPVKQDAPVRMIASL